MTPWRLSGVAERQMTDLLAHSANEYGIRHARNYEALLLAAMAHIAARPRHASAMRVIRRADIWVYDIRHARHHVPRGERIRNPWHKILYRPRTDGGVDILAIIGRSYPSRRAAREAIETG